MGTSITEGYLATDLEETSFRGLVTNWIGSNYTNQYVINLSYSGSKCWYSLALLSRFVAQNHPRLILIDWTNDRDNDHNNKSREAWIRRIRTELPDCNLALILWPIVESDGTLVSPHTRNEFFKNLADYYGISYVDVHEEVYQRVMINGEPLTNYYGSGDHLHPINGGHQLGMDLIEGDLGALIFGPRQFGTGAVLPAYLYTGTEDYVHYPSTYIDGTAYDSKTGAWTEGDDFIESSSPGATVTYSGNFATVGIWNKTRGYPNAELSVDGGAFLSAALFNGAFCGGYGFHSVTIRVLSTLRIDKFLAI